MVERITTTGLQLELLTFVNFERLSWLEALLGWNNSLIPASTYYSHNYSRIIGTGLIACTAHAIAYQDMRMLRITFDHRNRIVDGNGSWASSL